MTVTGFPYPPVDHVELEGVGGAEVTAFVLAAWLSDPLAERSFRAGVGVVFGVPGNAL